MPPKTPSKTRSKSRPAKRSPARTTSVAKRKARPRSASPSKPRENTPDHAWIRTLAAPYLRGYRPVAESRGPLRGYRFLAPSIAGAKSRAGFFVGYLGEPESYEFLQPLAPESIVFAFLEPAGSASHRRLVAQEGSLLRKTMEYIGWLTHRPPRFVFFDDRDVVLVRHFPMRVWPPDKHQHFSRNFFIETLAWLVRSGLVSKLASETRAKR
ncbi:MAG TPA: hypothetical protein VNI36_13540 [Candidatus Dormibacteraeota bacterium]|nr:hypothetical protein [Candidatus Dormibacteraeota bacterium]